MGRKLRLNNNSGLCYNANSGFEDASDSTFGTGIGLCDTPKPGSAKTVQHLSNINEDMTRTINVSTGAVHKTSVSVRFFQLTTLFLFILLFL